jgi:undecaprenyl-diphosphatase
MNYYIFHILNSHAGQADPLDDGMEFAANWLIYASFAIAAALITLSLTRRRIRPVAKLGAALAVAFAAGMAVAHTSHQVRPFQTHHVHQLIAHDPGVSMPSDHATAAFALAFGIGAFLSRRWGLVLAAVALAVGLGRIWVGVHYPGDIAAAAAIAALAVLVVTLGSRRWGHERARTACLAVAER